MANPLQPKVLKVLKQEYKAYAINIVSASKSGTMDIVASIPCNKQLGGIHQPSCSKVLARVTFDPLVGLFYGFEIKWKNDQPSELQKQKINDCIDAGGRAYFIRSVEQLRDILDNNILPIKYELKNKLHL